MEKVITSQKIVDDALKNGFKFIEGNQFESGIKYLEFALEQGVHKDQFLLYALLIANYNLGNFDKVNNYLEELKQIKIDNTVIKETITQITTELETINNLNEEEVKNLQNTAKNVIEDIKNLKFLQEKLPLTVEELENIVKKTNDEFFSFILKPSIEGALYEKFKEMELDFVKAIMIYEKFKDEYLKEEPNELILYKHYNNSLKKKSHIVFILLGIKDTIFYSLLREKTNFRHLKNEIIFDILAYKEMGFILEEMIVENVSPKYRKIKIKDVQTQIKAVEDELKKTPLYNDVNLFNYAGRLVVKYYKTHIYKFEKVEIQNIVERILEYFYYSDIIIDEELKSFIEEKYELSEKTYKKTVKEVNKLNLIL